MLFLQVITAIFHLLQRAVSLLQLSERYAMHGLSLFCCEALSKNLTVDTVCKIAAVAEQHSLRDLKEKAVSDQLSMRLFFGFFTQLRRSPLPTHYFNLPSSERTDLFWEPAAPPTVRCS